MTGRENLCQPARPLFKNYETLWGTVTYDNFMKSFAQYERDQALPRVECEDEFDVAEEDE